MKPEDLAKGGRSPSTAEPEKSDTNPHSYDPRHEAEKKGNEERKGIEKEFDRPEKFENPA